MPCKDAQNLIPLDSRKCFPPQPLMNTWHRSGAPTRSRSLSFVGVQLGGLQNPPAQDNIVGSCPVNRPTPDPSWLRREPAGVQPVRHSSPRLAHVSGRKHGLTKNGPGIVLRSQRRDIRARIAGCPNPPPTPYPAPVRGDCKRNAPLRPTTSTATHRSVSFISGSY